VMTNTCRRFYLIFRAAIFIVCIAISGKLLAAASNQYCNNNMNQHHIAFSVDALKKAPLDTGAKVELSRRELTTGMITSSEQNRSMAIDFNFQYTIVSVDDSITPMTNGHLHSWDFPVSWHHKGSVYTLDYYLVPVISVSSNVLKNPDLLDREAIQLWTGVFVKKDLSQTSTWLLGLRSDYRFGPYRVYPVVGVCWQPNANWQLQLVLPDISIRRFFSKGINIRLYAEPDGNKWHVFSKDTTRNSDFFYNAIVTGLSIEWRINPTIWLELSAVKHSRRDLSFALDNGTQLETSADSSTGLAVSAGFLF
jgi:hypothetical protein